MTVNNSSYWANRFIILEQELNNYSTETYLKAEQAFLDAQRQIDLDIEKWYNRIVKNNKISIVEARKFLTNSQIDEFKWTVEEYIKYGKENALNGQWIKQLENASAKVHISKLEALKLSTQHQMEVAFKNNLDYVDDVARNTYKNGYYKTMFEVQKAFSVGFEVGIDEKRLSKIISSPWCSDGLNFSDRVWQNKTSMINNLHKELTRTCILGGDPQEAIKNIQRYTSKNFKNSKFAAKRLIYTEQAFFASASFKDAFNDLDVEEFENVATLDLITSKICQQMDGKHFKMSEFIIGTTAPPFHPFCRTVTVPYFNDEFTTENMRASRGKDGKTEYVPADMKYDEWYATFVHSGLTDNVVGGIINLGENMYRKNRNLGDFSKFEVSMQKRKVKEIAKKYDIDLTGITIKIQRDKNLISLPMAGSTAYDDIGRIDLFPNAFIDEEQLIRTLIHEKVHVSQLKKYGFEYTQKNLFAMEKEAETIEELEWAKIKERVR